MNTIVAVSANRSWGRGKTIEEALANLKKAGGAKKGAALRLVVGDGEPYINGMGDLMLAQGAVSHKLTAN